MKLSKIFSKRNTRILSVIISFILLINMSIPVFAVSENAVSDTGLFTCVTNLMTSAGIEFDPSDLQTVFDSFRSGFGTVKSGFLGAIEFCRGFLDYLYSQGYIKIHPVTGLPVFDPFGILPTDVVIIDDNALDNARRPKATPSVSGDSASSSSQILHEFHVQPNNSSNTQTIYFKYDTTNGYRLYTTSSYSQTINFYYNKDCINTSDYPDIKWIKKSLTDKCIVSVRQNTYYYGFNNSSDCVLLNMVNREKTGGRPASDGNYYTFSFGSVYLAGGIASFTPAVNFYYTPGNSNLLCDSAPLTYYFGNSMQGGFTLTMDSSGLDSDACLVNSWKGGFVCGDCLAVFDDGALYYHNGSFYIVNYDGSGFEFSDGEDPDFVPVNQIITNVVNNYYTTIINNPSEPSVDYSGFFSSIISLLESIDAKLTLVLNKIDDQISAVTNNFNFAVNFETAINNTYNYLFVLTPEQQSDIDADLALIKSPFNWIFDFIDGAGNFLNSIASASSVYSTGSGFGDSSVTSLLKSDSSFDSFSASVSSGSVSSSFASFSSGSSSADGEGSIPLDCAPSFTIDLSANTSKYDWGGTAVALDFSWYSPYKPAVDKVIVCFCWAVFFWHLFKTIPSILQGGDGLVSEVNGGDIRENNRWAYRAGLIGRR